MYRLVDSLRATFQKPFGPILQTQDLPKHVKSDDTLVCIGDLVSRTAIFIGLAPKIIIVDFQTERKPLDPDLEAELRRYGRVVIRVRNEPATVSNELYAAVVQALRAAGPVRIEVEGEEDLAGLPVFAEAATGTVVLYGMPGQGVVFVRLDEAMRARARDLLSMMRA